MDFFALKSFKKVALSTGESPVAIIRGKAADNFHQFNQAETVQQRYTLAIIVCDFWVQN